MILRERTVVNFVCDTPTAAELHRPYVHLVHLWSDDLTVRLLNEEAADAAPSKLTCERQADRATANDQDRNFSHVDKSIGIASVHPHTGGLADFCPSFGLGRNISREFRRRVLYDLAAQRLDRVLHPRR